MASLPCKIALNCLLRPDAIPRIYRLINNLLFVDDIYPNSGRMCMLYIRWKCVALHFFRFYGTYGYLEGRNVLNSCPELNNLCQTATFQIEMVPNDYGFSM